jgi:GNAT superfamily N-acetyltransferase
VGLSSLPVPDPVVRRVGPGDRDELIRLNEVAGAELLGRKGVWLQERIDAPWASSGEAVDAVLQSPWVTCVGTLDEFVVGVAVGRIEAMHRDGSVGVIHALYVEPEGRSVGVGDALVVELLSLFQQAGCVGADAWALPGERETKNFYEAHGFSARVITVHHSFIGPMHESRTAALRATHRASASLGEGSTERSAQGPPEGPAEG